MILTRPRVNIVQAMAICAVSRRTIYNWIRDNRVEYVRTPSGGIRIYVDSLLREPTDGVHRIERTALSA